MVVQQRQGELKLYKTGRGAIDVSWGTTRREAAITWKLGTTERRRESALMSTEMWTWEWE